MTEIQNSKQISTTNQDSKPYYDLEKRTHEYARRVRQYCKQVKITIYNCDDIKQVIRSSGSLAANYIEANESLSKKDFIMRIKICRKETKETIHWLDLIEVMNDLIKEKQYLINEAIELMKIFGSILEKSK